MRDRRGFAGPGGGDSRPMPQGKKVQQPVTDDSIQVRQLSHYQFSWVAGDPGEEGTFTLQLVLDEGAWEEVLTVDAEDAEVLQSLLKRQSVVHYDIRRRTLMFGTTPVGN
jgi:hypothetical protein